MALILTRDDIQRCLTMAETIEAMRTAFTALYHNTAHVPQRLAVTLPEQGVALYMPSLLETPEQSFSGLKVVTVVPANHARNLPLIHSSVLLIDAMTGQTLAILEGSWLTAMRTGAACGLATDLLARRDADILTLFGAGGQAPTQALAMQTVRPLREIRVVNRDPAHYQHLVTTLRQLLGDQCPPIRHITSAHEALDGASIVCCTTTSTSPLWTWPDIAPGTHINAIGAFTPHMCEIDPETLAHARIVVDQKEAAFTEAGDLLQALEKGLIPGPAAWTELGELATRNQSARQHDDEITIFKSVGIGIQDVAAAWTVYRKAREQGIGINIEV